MKIRQTNLLYEGKRAPEVNVVMVFRDGQTYPLASRLDLARHSPDGFEWGYGGSGPAQLSLGLLADYFGATPEGDVFALCLHQDFKFAVIAGWKDRAWRVKGEQVGEHLVRLLVEDERRIHRLVRDLSLHFFTVWSQAHAGSDDPADYGDERINVWIDQRCRDLLSDYLPLLPATIERFLQEAKIST